MPPERHDTDDGPRNEVGRGAQGPGPPSARPGRRRARALPLIGAQVSTSGGLLHAVERGVSIGAEAIQIFPSNPRRWSPAAFTLADVVTFRQALDRTGLALFVHTIYLINLASPDEAMRERAVGALADALCFGTLAGAQGVVTHVGSHRGDGFAASLPRVSAGVGAAQEAAWARAARELSAARETPAGDDGAASLQTDLARLSPLLLESSAGSGDSVGRDPDELCLLLDSLAHAPSPCGLCLDTAHMFAAGFPVHTEEGLEAVLGDLRAGGCLEAVGLVHLNDCKSALGSKADRHENLGDGLLGLDGLAVSVRHPDLVRVPFVLEVPGLEGKGPDRENLQRAKRLRRPPGGSNLEEKIRRSL